MTTDGGGWTKALNYNGQVPLYSSSAIGTSDWLHGDNNYSRLYSMMDIKSQSGIYEFKIENFM